ncbi:MAG: hypothetical protein O3A13_06995, partial [Proteobacteria bacterium]|nr:hypothetical protein [Pseudomonadota bacterium]
MTARHAAHSDLAADEAIQILQRKLSDQSLPAGRCREALAAASENLIERFRAGESVVKLVHARSDIVDQILVRLWQEYVADFASKAA